VGVAANAVTLPDGQDGDPGRDPGRVPIPPRDGTRRAEPGDSPGDATAAPILEAHELAVGRGGRPVLAGVNLRVGSGERLALVGANGSGKTTLLRALAGLDAALAGVIQWDGGELPRGSERVRQVGVLFQGETPPGFTVRELVCLGLGLDGPPSGSAAGLLGDVLGRMDLDPLVERSCAFLSGGEWQRAVLARSLVARPGLLLLDEPTNHLDPARRAALFALLDRLRGSVAAVLATHDLECAATCDRVVLLGDSRVVAVGSPSEVLTPPTLASVLGIRVRRVDDPEGGSPFLRVVGPS